MVRPPALPSLCDVLGIRKLGFSIIDRLGACRPGMPNFGFPTPVSLKLLFSLSRL